MDSTDDKNKRNAVRPILITSKMTVELKKYKILHRILSGPVNNGSNKFDDNVITERLKFPYEATSLYQ